MKNFLNTKFWIADIFYKNVEYFNSKDSFEARFNQYRENKIQFTWNIPDELA